MVNLEERIRLAAESLLDNEALRSGLNDEDAARLLLDWGLSWAKTLVGETAAIEDEIEAEDAIAPRLKALRRLMMALKDLAIAENWNPDEVQGITQTALAQAKILHGETWQPGEDFAQKVAAILQNGDPRFRLRALLELLDQGREPEISPSLQPDMPSSPTPLETDKQPPASFWAKLWQILKGK